MAASQRSGETIKVTIRIATDRQPSAATPKAGTTTVEPDNPFTQAETSSTFSTAIPIACQAMRSRPNG